MLRKTDKYLLIIFVFALVIRLVGIDHGFPFIFHPDEPAVVRSATGIRFQPNPGHFDWPHLHFYLNYFVFEIFIKMRGLVQQLGLRESFEGIWPILWRDPLVFYLLSRVLDAFMGAATVIPIYMSVKNLFRQEDERVQMKKDFDKQAGFPRAAALFAALALALTPFHVHVSHFALIDVPMFFWFSWAIYFSTNIFFSKDLRNYLLAGLFVGLSASTKYNGVMSSLLVVSAHFIRVWKSQDEFFLSPSGWGLLILAGVASAVGFIFGTPYSVLDYDTFKVTDSPKGAFWQFRNVGSVGYKEQLSQAIGSLRTKLPDDFGFTFLAVYLVTPVVALFKKNSSKLWFFLLPSLVIFFYISGAEKIRSHYFMPFYPFVMLSVGYVCAKLWQKFSSKHKIAIAAILMFIFIVPAYYTLKEDGEFSKPDSRVALYRWLDARVSEGDFLAYNTDDLAPVMEKFSNNKKDKGIEKADLEGKTGYVSIVVDRPGGSTDTENDEKDISGDIDKVLDIYGGYAEPVAFFDGKKGFKGLSGPVIYVYKFDLRSSAGRGI